MVRLTDLKINHQVYLDARGHIERQQVAFFDFYRETVYGFVRTGEGKAGHYATLTVSPQDGSLTAVCKCRQSAHSKVCGHAFALYLKLIHWPLEQRQLSKDFDNHPFVQFVRTLGTRHCPASLEPSSNPRLDLSGIHLDQRLTDLWGFTNHSPEVARRDRIALDNTKNRNRDSSEKNMLRKGFPSALVLFEESMFYSLCKLLFHLELHAQPQMVVSLADHQVELTIRSGKQVVFTWLMSVEDYLKGIRGNSGRQWEYWQSHTHFEIRRQSVPLIYRVGFSAESDLEIEPMVALGDGRFEALAKIGKPGSKNLYFHDKLGYFGIQTGLSPFEMSYATAGVHQIDAQDVKAFLKQHRETLDGLDRAQMDEAVFGDVVVEYFDSLAVQLHRHDDRGFSIGLDASLGNKVMDLPQLVQLLGPGKGRYRKVGNKLLDTAGYDAAFLTTLLRQNGGSLSEEDLAKLSAGELLRLLALFKDRLSVQTNDLTASIYQNLSSFKTPNIPSLDHTKLTLRPYQQVGYEWLYFLKNYGLGGLLCDQMGLGKTHQGMALIAAVLKERPASQILVVAPTSVLFHWREKLNDFCPEVAIEVYHGPDRNLAQALEKSRVLISTYGTLRNDARQLDEYRFELVLFDEIQNLKNKDTKAYKSLSLLKAHCKIGLTGTPIENDISELKNLLDLVFPGFLGSDAHFKRFFVDPVTKFNNARARESMKAMVNPFTLRRSKDQVLTDLPEKTEDMLSYSLSAYERDIYDQFRQQGKKSLNSGDHNYTHVFQLVEKLKQICNHPGLFHKHYDYKAYPSTKWDMFTELLEEALLSGEKVVVFTQYLGMLTMFKAYLEDRGVDYAVIQGETKDREGEQKRFQTDPQCRVFLGSLRAAGVGIDLTAGSILFHYDRWWNPAREEQATDRIHRIGQKNSCQVFKFKAYDSVESRIDKIIRRKARLLQDVVGFDSGSVAKSISLDELLEVLG